MPQRRGSRLSRERIHDALTDVCAEVYLLKAERLRIRGTLDSRSHERDQPSFDEQRLLEQEAAVENRLDALEAKTALLRADLERSYQQHQDR